MQSEANKINAVEAEEKSLDVLEKERQELLKKINELKEQLEDVQGKKEAQAFIKSAYSGIEEAANEIIEKCEALETWLKGCSGEEVLSAEDSQIYHERINEIQALVKEVKEDKARVDKMAQEST